MALQEDPDYARAHYRKCTILAEKGDIKRAIVVANSAIVNYSNEMETDQANIKMVPLFKNFIEENEEKEELAEEQKLKRMEEEVEKEIDQMFPLHDLEGELRKIDEQYGVPESESDQEEQIPEHNESEEEKSISEINNQEIEPSG